MSTDKKPNKDEKPNKNQDPDKDQDPNKKEKNLKPDCFGHLDQVFPMTDSGLRETPEKCFEQCELKTDCLKYAMTTKQACQVEEEIIERGSKTGAINFFERWSRKKQVHKKIKESGKINK
ncbi:MAG: hypothetical protein ABIJ59_17580 [Pseudomonadota bacterium]